MQSFLSGLSAMKQQVQTGVQESLQRHKEKGKKKDRATQREKQGHTVEEVGEDDSGAVIIEEMKNSV